MPTTVLATSHDVAARWRPLRAEELLVVDAWLADASAVLRVRAAERGVDVDSRIAEGLLDGQVVAGVVARMVIPVLEHPDPAVESESRTTGPYGHTVRYAAAPERRARLHVPDDDLVLLGAPAERSRLRVGTVHVRPGLTP